MSGARTVLVVDDHPSFRAAARALLENAGYVVVAEAADAASAVIACDQERPALVLLDVQLPDEDGFAVAEILATREDGPAVIMTSSRNPRDFGPLVERSPVRGFIAKEALSATTLAELWG